MTPLPHSLERSIRIEASAETVFRYFTDSARWAAWWGAGSTIDARPGGAIHVRHPNGVEASGEVVEIRPPERIVFTYGYASGKPMAPGSSRVTIELESQGQSTRLHLTHAFADSEACAQHVQGWRYQLSVFANVVADELHAGAAKLVDAWFHAWTITSDSDRTEALKQIAAPGLRFRNRFSYTEGIADLSAQIGATHRFMPGVRLERNGEVLHCQGSVLAPWVAVAKDGAERMRGSSVFMVNAAGLIDAVTGFESQGAANRAG